MAEITKSKTRVVYRNIHITDLANYRMPASAYVSILHRVSGAIMFLLLPLVIWLFDNSLSSEISYETFSSAFGAGIGFVPGWFVKLVVLVLIWSYLHHFVAGVRHLWMDMNHNATDNAGRKSAKATLVISIVLTIALGAKLFSLY
ncbi:succinate dehydrogenase, cytochrome b556 subunit [soil metagenome]